MPNTSRAARGANRDRRFFIKQISAPTGYYQNTTLAVGTTVVSTGYSFQTGTQLRNGTIYRSTVDFMIDTGNTNNVASGGIWQASRINPVASGPVRHSRGDRRGPVELGRCRPGRI